MQNPWKVVAAFIGVFIAGAVFGAFFVMGVGSRLVPPTPAAVPPPAAPPVATTAPASPAPAPAVAPKPVNPQAAAQQKWAALLPVPQGWQAPQLLRRYAERLGLTAEQKERVFPVIQRAAEDYRRLQATTFRETAIILQRLQQDIAKELTPEQREKMEQFEEEQRDRLQKMEQRSREQKKAQGGARPAGARNPAKAEGGPGAEATPHNAPPTVSPAASSPEAPPATSTAGSASEKKE